MYPTRRFSARLPKMFRFSGVYQVETYSFLSCKRSKIGTFLDAGRRCGAGVSQGDMPFRNVPLSRLLLVLFLAKQEKYISALQGFYNPKFIHKGCGMWKESLWKKCAFNFLPQGLLISSSFQHLPCGEKSVAPVTQNGLFHIILYYGCYD